MRSVTSQGDDATLPDTILGVIQARLDALGEHPGLMIRAASVFGHVFPVDGLKALLHVRSASIDVAGWLRVLTEREVVFPQGAASEQQYGFRHALIREAAYALLPAEERVLDHRLAAEWLEGRGSVDAALLADHFERGETFASAARWYGVAATQALDAGSFDEVARCGERAVACGLSGEPLGEVSSIVGEALSYGEQDARAEDWSDAAFRSLPMRSAGWWRAVQVLSTLSFRRGSHSLERSQDLARAMIEAASGPAPSIPEQIIALSCAAANAPIYGHRELGQRLLSLLPAHIPEALGGRAQGMAHTARLMACFTADLSRALQHAREALVAFRRVGAIRDVLGLLTNTACLLVELGAFEEAASMLEEAVELAERLASKARVYGALQNLGYLCLQSGQLERGVEVLTEVVPFYASVGLPRDEATSLAYLALLHGRRSALELAKATSVRSVQLASEPEVEALVLAVAASIDLLCGSPYDALHSAQRAFDLLQEYQLPEHLALTRVARAESLLACGRTDEAREAIAEAHAWLLSRASRIEDPHDRESLLTRVPENARIVQLAAQWLSASA